MSRGRYWHVSTSKITRWAFPTVGLIFIASGIAQRHTAVGIYLIIAGIYCLLRSQIADFGFRRLLKKNPQYGKVMHWSFSSEGFKGHTDNATFESDWSALFRTVTTPEGFLLYPQKEIYYWIPASAFTNPTDVKTLTEILRDNTKNTNAV